MLLDVAGLAVDLPVHGGMLHAVRGIDITLERGETLGIVGESGCGKSLTALALMGLQPATAQRTATRMRLGDTDLLAMRPRDLAREVHGVRMAMIFQEPMTSLNPVYSIGRQLTEASVVHGRLTQAAAQRRAIELLERVGITGAERRLAQYPHQLSGGQRQRVMIAMALMNAPQLLIADEPTTALDVTIQAQILRLLAELQRELGMAMILITHHLGIVARIAERVAVMYAGEIVETGTSGAVFGDPRHPYTRGLLGAIPQPAVHRPGARLGSIRGIVPSLIGTLRGCSFAPRCGLAAEHCTASDPPVQMLGDGRIYRCIIDASGSSQPQAQDAQPGATTASPRTQTDAHPTLLDARDLHCEFQVKRGIFAASRPLKALDGVSLDIRRGEIVALVGESGCGKTTLSRVLLGLLDPGAGTVTLDGQPLHALPRRDLARRMQPIFQDPYASLNPRHTLAQIIGRPLAVHGVGTREERREKVRELMALVGLPPRLAYSYPHQLSGGQRQRAAIARAIILEPALVICDEPTSALDVSVQSQILNLLLDLRERLGLTYLMITHDLAVVQHMATRVAVMYLGEIVEVGDAARILAAPRHPYTRALLDSALTVAPAAGIPDNRMGTSFPNPLERPSGCRFHPRCPSALPMCAREVPPEIADHASVVRCHLHLADCRSKVVEVCPPRPAA
ncbi:MAG: ABC transporter ATP-binding protein [Burkholderiales bacterium]|nr:ABC transporter ATP-binding protein [Burkholderiales bacterium]